MERAMMLHKSNGTNKRQKIFFLLPILSGHCISLVNINIIGDLLCREEKTK
jgi:hypothetical protein